MAACNDPLLAEVVRWNGSLEAEALYQRWPQSVLFPAAYRQRRVARNASAREACCVALMAVAHRSCQRVFTHLDPFSVEHVVGQQNSPPQDNVAPHCG